MSVERYGDVDRQMKKVRIDGMQFQADEIATNTIVTQIKVLCENADVFKATMGEAKYNEQLVALINKMPGISPKVKFGSEVNTVVLEEPRRKLRETKEVMGGGGGAMMIVTAEVLNCGRFFVGVMEAVSLPPRGGGRLRASTRSYLATFSIKLSDFLVSAYLFVRLFAHR